MSRNCCAALYIKVAYTVGTVYNNFVIAKSGINPSLLPRIIPNLERMSVKKAVQLCKSTSKDIDQRNFHMDRKQNGFAMVGNSGGKSSGLASKLLCRVMQRFGDILTI
jgi:hypothetical protein